MSVIGLDIGTTGCKAIVFGPDWEILGRAAREYAVLTPHVDWAEQDAERVWELALAALTQAVDQAAVDPPRAMALSVQGEAVIPVDGTGRPIRHAILGMDTRSTAENDWLAETFDPQVLFRRTGMPMHTINTITKLLWLRRNEPEVWASARQFLLYEDYFLRRLTGRAIISHCLASRHADVRPSDLPLGEDILDRVRSATLPLTPARLRLMANPLSELDRAVARHGVPRERRSAGQWGHEPRPAPPGQWRDRAGSGHGLHGDGRGGGGGDGFACLGGRPASGRHLGLPARRAGVVCGHDPQSQRRNGLAVVPGHTLPGQVHASR